MKIKRLIPTFACFGLFWLLCGGALAQVKAQPIFLRFQEQNQDLNYITTYYRESMNLINISDDTGKSDTLQNESYDYGEFMKKQQQINASPFIQIFNKISVLKTESKPPHASSGKPLEMQLRIEPRGRLQIPFSFAQLPYFGIPVVFPDEPVSINQEWAGSLDFHDEDLPSLNLNQKFVLKKIETVGGHAVAQIDYTLRTELHATDVSEDSIVQQKIGELKSQNIEAVSYDGQGSLTFDFTNGRIHTHLLTLTTRLSKAYLVDNKRTLKETTTSYEFAEALLP